MPASTKKLRVIRYIDGQTYYVTVQLAGLKTQQLPEGQTSPKGHMLSPQSSRPKRPSSAPEYTPVFSPKPIEPGFAFQTVERKERSPRWFRAHAKKEAVKAAKKERLEHATKVKQVRAENLIKTFQPEVQQAIPVRAQPASRETVKKWYKDAHQGNVHPRIPASYYCEQYVLPISIKEGKLIHLTRNMRIEQSELLSNLQKLDKLFHDNKVEWSKWYKLKPCQCANCFSAQHSDAYFGSGKTVFDVTPESVAFKSRIQDAVTKAKCLADPKTKT